MAKKIPKSLHSWLIPKLRRLSMYWPSKTIARDMAKVYIQEGSHKNGNPIFRVYFICAMCVSEGKKKNYHKLESTQMDHIDPAMDIKGFKDWNTYMPSLFPLPTGYQCLCIEHHKQKTDSENVERVIFKKYKKKP